MNKQLFFFDPNEFSTRRNTTREEFIKMIEPEASKILNLMDRSFHEMVTRRDERRTYSITPNWCPVEMNANIRGNLVDTYGVQKVNPKDTIVEVGRNERFYLNLAGKFKIYFKKLDKYHQPRNILTKNDYLIKNQLSDNSEDVNPNIFIGYTVNKHWNKITGIYAVKLVGTTDKEWEIDLNLLVANKQPLAKNISLNSKSKELNQKPLVKIKKGLKRKKAE
ncbi:MAG: hypothetical protein AAFP89_04925 [Bacteroidota bacterium]